MKSVSARLVSAGLTLALSGALTVVSFMPVVAADSTISGTIVETMNAADYTYVLIDGGTDKIWAAIPRTSLTAGETISLAAGMEMKNFHSTSLDRTFDSIIFSPGIAGAKPASPHGKSTRKQSDSNDSFAAAVAAERGAAGASPQVQPQEVSSGSMGAVAPFAETSVEKAPGENSYTVGEIFEQAQELDGKKVRVRAQVVKFNSNIMGKNWLHLQDGTGDPMKNTHDLVVTTIDELSGPKIITVEGTVAADKDFGAGYRYQVLIEDGSIAE